MISVVIPTYNEAAEIEKTLAQFLRTAEPCEVIIVDGGSTDYTKKIVRTFIEHHKCSSFMRLMTGPGGGRGRTLQTGAESASGDVLLFLHADTLLPKGWQFDVYSAFADACVIGGAFRLSFNNPNWFYRGVAGYANLRARVFEMYHGDQAQFIRTAVFRRIGGFPPVPLMEDVLLSHNMKRHRGETVHLSTYVLTSSRRIERYGRLKTIMRYFTIKLLFLCGASPQVLAKIYAK